MIIIRSKLVSIFPESVFLRSDFTLPGSVLRKTDAHVSDNFFFRLGGK